MSSAELGHDLAVDLQGVTLVHQNQPRFWVHEHSHEQHEVLIPLSGTFELTLADKKHHVMPEQMFWLPEGTKHAFASDASTQGERLIILFEPELWKKWRGTTRTATIFPSHQLIKEIAFYLLSGSQKGSRDALTNALVAMISDVVCQHPEIDSQTTSTLENQTVKKALEIIAAGFTDDLSIDDLAARVGVAPRTLSRLFAEHVAISPKQVLIRHRVQEACRLLRDTRLSVTDVAFEAGFGSLSRFIESFRAQVGVLPSDYRTRNAR